MKSVAYGTVGIQSSRPNTVKVGYLHHGSWGTFDTSTRSDQLRPGIPKTSAALKTNITDKLTAEASVNITQTVCLLEIGPADSGSAGINLIMELTAKNH